MISQRIEDFDEIISIIKKCMQENQWLLYLPRDELEKKIAESFYLEVNDANKLDLIKFLGKQIEDIANETDPINKKISVDGTRWMVYYHHLYLLFGIAHCVPGYYKDVIQQLQYNALLRRKIRLTENQLMIVFKYSLFLYLLNGRKNISDRYDRRWFEAICNALNYFKNIPYDIKEGEIDFTPQGHLQIHHSLESKIKMIGGIQFLDYCRELLLKPSYNDLFDRYIIYRKKSTTTNLHTIPLGEVPVYYLIKLGMKNLSAQTNYLECGKTKVEIFKEICFEARAYLYLLNLSSDSIYEDVMLSIDELPRYIVKNLIYDSLLVPDQFSTNYLLVFMEKVFQPVIDEEYPALSAFVKRYRHFAKCVFNMDDNIFAVKELKRKSGLKNEDLNEILVAIVLNYDKVNCDFTQMNAPTNCQLYPLVCMPDGNLYRFDNHISAYGFYCSLYNILNAAFKENKINLNKSLGIQMEKFVRDMLENGGWQVKKGSYSLSKGDVQECDGFIENDKNIIGIEMKYCRFLKDFSTGDDVKMFNVIARGMLKAYKQNLRHYYDLRCFEYLPLVASNESNKENNLKYNNRRFISVSVCSSDYRFFSAGLLSRKMLNAIAVADFKTYSSERQEELEYLEEVQRQIRELINKFQHIAGERIVREVLHNVLFISAPQLHVMCRLHKEGFGFIDQLKGLLSVSYGTMDIYAELLAALKLGESEK